MCAVDFTVRQFLIPLASALKEQGHTVVISCARGSYFDEIRAMGFDIRDNPVSRSMNILSHSRAIWRTYRMIRREKFDVVHVHTPIAALIGRIAARLAGVPVKIYTAHGFYFHDEMSPARKRAYIALERLGGLCGDFIMTVSAEDEAAAVKYGIVKPECVETIYNGVDMIRFDPARFPATERTAIRRQYRIAMDAPVIGIVGRLVREKGFFELFEAACIVLGKYPETKFLIVGDVLPSDYDASKAEFMDRIVELGIRDAFIFAGMVDDTSRCLAAMDIFTLPSYREGMPVSLLEAMAMELPAVATDIRGCREEILDGKTGWLVPSRNSAALAEKLVWLLDNHSKSHFMGKMARERVAEMFDIKKVVSHQLEIYARLTAFLRD